MKDPKLTFEIVAAVFDTNKALREVADRIENNMKGEEPEGEIDLTDFFLVTKSDDELTALLLGRKSQEGWTEREFDWHAETIGRLRGVLYDDLAGICESPTKLRQQMLELLPGAADLSAEELAAVNALAFFEKWFRAGWEARGAIEQGKQLDPLLDDKEV